MTAWVGAGARRWGWWALFAVAALAAAIVVLREGSAWTFNVDDWGMILYRRNGGASAFLAPHRGNLEPLLVAVYRGLFATVGLRHFTVYRGVALVLHLALAGLLFAYLRVRLPDVLAFLLTLPILFLAYGYSVLVWSYDIEWIVTPGCMLLVFLLRDTGSRRRAPLTLLLLLVAVATSGPVAAVLVAVVVDTLLNRNLWREWWTVAVPLALYGAWVLLVRSHVETPLELRHLPGANPAGDTQSSILAEQLHGSRLPHLPDALLKSSNAASGGLFGLHSSTYWPLLVAAAAVGTLVWIRRKVPPRAIACLAGALTLWTLVGLFRRPDEYASNRYVYVGAIFLMVILAELLSSRTVRRGLLVLAAAIVVAILAADLHRFQQAGRFARNEFPSAVAELRHLACDPTLAPSTPARSPLLPLVTSGPLRAAFQDLGSPVGRC